MSILTVVSGLVAAFAVAYLVAYLWPGSIWLSGIVVSLSGIGSIVVCWILISRSWVVWALIPALALAGLGTVLLPQGLADLRDGSPVDVVVTDHQVEERPNRNPSGGWMRYTHEYALERVDGDRIDQPLKVGGKYGYEELEPGTKTTVLIDDDSGAPLRPAENTETLTYVGLAGLVLGGIPTLGILIACAIVLARRRAREPRQVVKSIPPTENHYVPPTGYCG